MISPRWNSLTTGIPVFSGFCWKRVCLRSFEEVWGSFFVNEIQKLSRLYQLLYHVLSFYLSFRSDARIAISLVSFPNTNLGGKRQPCFASDYNLQLMDRKKKRKRSLLANLYSVARWFCTLCSFMLWTAEKVETSLDLLLLKASRIVVKKRFRRKEGFQELATRQSMRAEKVAVFLAAGLLSPAARK